MPDMSKYDLVLLACMPVDASTVPGMPAEALIPTIEDTLAQCENPDCQQDMWIGPKQLAAREEMRLTDHPHAVICLPCAVVAKAIMTAGSHIRTAVEGLGSSEGIPRRI